MALKHKIDSLDGLDEALKPLYAKGADGRYTLQVDESPATNTINELKNKLKALEDKEEKARLDAEEAKARATGDFEKLKQNFEAKEKDYLKQVEEAHMGLKSYLLKSELTAAIAANKGNPHLLKLVSDQFEAVLSPDGAHKVLAKSDPTKTPVQIIEALKKDATYQPFFEGSGASGGGAPQSGGAAPAKKWSEMGLKERTELTIQNPTLAKQLQGAN